VLNRRRRKRNCLRSYSASFLNGQGLCPNILVMEDTEFEGRTVFVEDCRHNIDERKDLGLGMAEEDQESGIEDKERKKRRKVQTLLRGKCWVTLLLKQRDGAGRPPLVTPDAHRFHTTPILARHGWRARGEGVDRRETEQMIENGK